jgi:hypothetical protein
VELRTFETGNLMVEFDGNMRKDHSKLGFFNGDMMAIWWRYMNKL